MRQNFIVREDITLGSELTMWQMCRSIQQVSLYVVGTVVAGCSN